MDKKEANRTEYQVGQLSIAGIHATILSILIAILSAYFFQVNSAIQDMELQIINSAEKINGIPFLRYSYLPPEPFVMPEDSSAKIEKITYIFLLLSNHPSKGDYPANFQIPAEPSERAEKALQLTNIIAHRYPFPNAVWKTENGWLQKLPEPIVFGNLSDVSKWLSELNQILKTTILFRNVPDKFLSESYIGYFESLESRKKEHIERARKDPMFRAMGVVEPRILFSNFIEGLNGAEKISLDVEYRLNKMAKYIKSHLPRRILIVTILSAGIVFLLSVIVPIVFRGASRVLWVYLPSVYYIIVLIYFAAMMFTEIA